MKKSKRYLEIKSKIEDKEYSLNDSLNLIKDISSAKFDESVEIHLQTNADPKNADQQLSLIHISEPTRLRRISYAVFCLKKKKEQKEKNQNTNTPTTSTLPSFIFFLMIRRPPRSTPKPSSAASDVYKRQTSDSHGGLAE